MAENKKALEDESLESINIITQDKAGSKKDSFILYTEQKEIIEALTDEDAGALFKTLYQYVNGENPTITNNIKIAFIAIRQQLDRNAEKYEAKREKLKQNGLKGGRPKKIENQNKPNGLSENQMVILESKKSLYVNDNVNVNNINDHSNKNFEEFWNKYPKKLNKKKSETIFLQAIKKTNPQDILKGVDNYNKHIKVNNIQIQYIKHPTTWLNGECWDDEYSNNIQEVKEYVYNPCL